MDWEIKTIMFLQNFLIATLVISSKASYHSRQVYNCTDPLRECTVTQIFKEACFVHECKPEEKFPCQIELCGGFFVHEYFSLCPEISCKEILKVSESEEDEYYGDYEYDISGNFTNHTIGENVTGGDYIFLNETQV